MSSAVRHPFQTPPNAAPERQPSAPAPIVIPSPDVMRALDLFQPEPANGVWPEPASADVVPFADGQFARQVARALEAPPTEAAWSSAGPSDAEVASARALVIAWIAACAIAVFAFLSQGPTLSMRDPEAPAETIEAATPPGRGDIRLEANTKVAPTRPKKSERAPAPPASPAPPPQPQP
jgi:hypothetical protein